MVLMMVMRCGMGALSPIDGPPINIYLIKDAHYYYIYIYLAKSDCTDDGNTQKVLFTPYTRSFQFKQIDEANG